LPAVDPVTTTSWSAVVAQKRLSTEQRWRAAKAALAPASVKEIGVLLQQLCELHKRELSELVVRIYIDVLREQPATVIAAAVRQHIATSKWFPRPSELLDLCKSLRWDLEVELDNAQAEVRWSYGPAFGRTKTQLMAQRRKLYGENLGPLWDEWFNMMLGEVPPSPAPREHLSAEALATIEMRTRAEWEAEQQRVAAVLNEPPPPRDEEYFARVNEVLERQRIAEQNAKRAGRWVLLPRQPAPDEEEE
jgi:hypothetical protein